jgi:hypothetical protein
MSNFIRLISNDLNNKSIAEFASVVATVADSVITESDNEHDYMDLVEYDTPEGSVLEIALSEDLTDEQIDIIVEQINLQDFEIQASLTEAYKTRIKIGDVLHRADHADKAAKQLNAKVVRTASGYYKVAPLDDPRPAVTVNTDYYDQQQKLNKEIRQLRQQTGKIEDKFNSERRKVFDKLDSLFPNSKHGDEKSSRWLRDALDKLHEKYFGRDLGGFRTTSKLTSSATKFLQLTAERRAKEEELKQLVDSNKRSVPLESLTEATNEKLVVVYPGRFHPFHKGHAGVYNTLKQQYGGIADVYIATSGKTEPNKSPFSFAEKLEMMKLTGINPNAVVQTRQPYVAEEITNKYNMNNTVVLYVVSEKDMAEDPRFNFPTKGPNLKKDGQPAHMQKWNGWDNARSLEHHSYVTTVPTTKFNVLGEPATSATEIRQRFPMLSNDQQKAFITDLFGNYSDNVLNIMRNKLGDSNE